MFVAPSLCLLVINGLFSFEAGPPIVSRLFLLQFFQFLLLVICYCLRSGCYGFCNRDYPSSVAKLKSNWPLKHNQVPLVPIGTIYRPRKWVNYMEWYAACHKTSALSRRLMWGVANATRWRVCPFPGSTGFLLTSAVIHPSCDSKSILYLTIFLTERYFLCYVPDDSVLTIIKHANLGMTGCKGGLNPPSVWRKIRQNLFNVQLFSYPRIWLILKCSKSICCLFKWEKINKVRSKM